MFDESVIRALVAEMRHLLAGSRQSGPLELEARLGHRMDVRTNARVSGMDQAWDPRHHRWVNGISREDWCALYETLVGDAAWTCMPTVATVDEVYARGARRSRNPATGHTTVMTKRRLVIHDVALPDLGYDVRFTVNEEQKTLDPAAMAGAPLLRHKTRTSFVSASGAAVIDLTMVSVGEDGGHGAGTSYEAELELRCLGAEAPAQQDGEALDEFTELAASLATFFTK